MTFLNQEHRISKLIKPKVLPGIGIMVAETVILYGVIKIHIMRTFLIMLAIFTMSLGCKKDLKLTKQGYTGKEIRIDGYYYEELINPSNGGYGSCYFFYKNGVILYGDAFRIDKINESEARFIDPNWLNGLKKYQINWGVYNITGNVIKFEKWYPSSGGPLPTYVREGNILNDTTFVITQTYRYNWRSKEKSKANVNEVYHFKAFSPKPDSTNSFVP